MTASSLTILRSPALSEAKGVTHGFFSREGGISRGIYAGLNCGTGSDDAPADVLENRRRVAEALQVADTHLVSLYQIHSPITHYVDTVWQPGESPQADAMVTDRPGIALGILTADCTPVLLADPSAGVIGAAHAGWKGAVGGVLESVVQEMERRGADRSTILAAIGPTISQANYEVGRDFRDTFLAHDAENEHWFATGKDEAHFQFDLPGYVASTLKALGVGHVEDLKRCTYADETLFYSYRRTTHRSEPDYGRGISAIALT